MGWASDNGSAKCQACGAGMFGNGCKKCPLGFAREGGDIDATQCRPCPLGETTTIKGAATCSGCDLGTYGSSPGNCSQCDLPNTYVDFRGATLCSTCPAGKRPNVKRSGCELPPWGQCKVGEYLNNTHPNQNDWQCVNCPYGSDCTSIDPLPTASTLKPNIGYRSLSWDDYSFEKCPILSACNNSFNGGCALGHNPNASELCNQCFPHFASEKRGGICKQCPDASVTVFLFCGAVVLAVVLFYFLVWDTLDSANDMIAEVEAHKFSVFLSTNNIGNTDGKVSTEHRISMPFHSIVIRIISSYLQIAGMLLQFDLQLPNSVRSLIVAKASASTLSEPLLLFDCGTEMRNDYELFELKQVTSVWTIPLSATLACVLFWSFAQCCVLRRKKTSLTGLNGFISSLMVLFYTLFPSVVSRVALAFSCKRFGTGVHRRNLLTEALSVQCFSPEHWSMIIYIGIPGILVYIACIPALIALTLVRQRRKQQLYPSQNNYDPKWTLRFGFMFAGYREGYEWWETIVMLRKCCFVLLAIYLRQYGAAPQVVAASLVLVAALSAALQHLPYQDLEHNKIETLGIQVCLLQLMVALLCNLVQDDGGSGGSGGSAGNDISSNLGPNSTVFLIFVVFGSTVYFFFVTVRATIQHSLETKGVVGKLAQCMKKCCRVKTKREQMTPPQPKHKNIPKSMVVPAKPSVLSQQQKANLKKEINALKWQKNMRQAMLLKNKVVPKQSGLSRVKSRRTKQVEEIEKNHQNHRNLAIQNIKKQQSNRRSSVQLRLAARTKVKHSKALLKSTYFSNLDPDSTSNIVDAMELVAIEDKNYEICRQGDAADIFYIIISGTCNVSIDGNLVTVLGELDVFGEQALFGDATSKRGATVETSGDGPVQVLALSRTKFDQLIASGILNQACVITLKRETSKRIQRNEQMMKAKAAERQSIPKVGMTGTNAQEEKEQQEKSTGADDFLDGEKIRLLVASTLKNCASFRKVVFKINRFGKKGGVVDGMTPVKKKSFVFFVNKIVFKLQQVDVDQKVLEALWNSACGAAVKQNVNVLLCGELEKWLELNE